MRKSVLAVSLLYAAISISTAFASPLLQPSMRLEPSAETRVALTFDACDGRTDMRILSTLVDNHIPATIFVTGKWLRRNAPALAVLKAHPDLFEIENHGLRHLPPIDTPRSVYGLHSAGSAAALKAEVVGGGDAMRTAGLSSPSWYRGATAEYTASSIAEIRGLGFRIAGFSRNGDDGAALGAKSAERRVAAAQDGDVIIAHINHPERPAGQGVVAGILDLKAKGVRFVRLSDAGATGSDDTTQ